MSFKHQPKIIKQIRAIKDRGKFLRSIMDFYHKNGFITPKQKSAARRVIKYHQYKKQLNPGTSYFPATKKNR